MVPPLARRLVFQSVCMYLLFDIFLNVDGCSLDMLSNSTCFQTSKFCSAYNLEGLIARTFCPSTCGVCHSKSVPQDGEVLKYRLGAVLPCGYQNFTEIIDGYSFWTNYSSALESGIDVGSGMVRIENIFVEACAVDQLDICDSHLQATRTLLSQEMDAVIHFAVCPLFDKDLADLYVYSSAIVLSTEFHFPEQQDSPILLSLSPPVGKITTIIHQGKRHGLFKVGLAHSEHLESTLISLDGLSSSYINDSEQLQAAEFVLSRPLDGVNANGVTNIDAVLHQMQDAQVQLALFIVTHEESIEITRRIAQLSISFDLVSFHESSLRDLVESLPVESSFISTSEYWSPDWEAPCEVFGSNSAFVSEFRSQFGRVPSEREAAGAALGLVLQHAMQRAGSINRHLMAHALRGPHTQPVQSIYGPLIFSEEGINVGREPRILQIQDLEVRTVYPKSLSEATLVAPVPSWECREAFPVSRLQNRTVQCEQSLYYLYSSCFQKYPSEYWDLIICIPSTNTTGAEAEGGGVSMSLFLLFIALSAIMLLCCGLAHVLRSVRWLKSGIAKDSFKGASLVVVPNAVWVEGREVTPVRDSSNRIEVVGMGTFGEVFTAMFRGTKVAVKIIVPEKDFHLSAIVLNQRRCQSPKDVFGIRRRVSLSFVESLDASLSADAAHRGQHDDDDDGNPRIARFSAPHCHRDPSVSLYSFQTGNAEEYSKSEENSQLRDPELLKVETRMQLQSLPSNEIGRTQDNSSAANAESPAAGSRRSRFYTNRSNDDPGDSSHSTPKQHRKSESQISTATFRNSDLAERKRGTEPGSPNETPSSRKAAFMKAVMSQLESFQSVRSRRASSSKTSVDSEKSRCLRVSSRRSSGKRSTSTSPDGRHSPTGNGEVSLPGKRSRKRKKSPLGIKGKSPVEDGSPFDVSGRNSLDHQRPPGGDTRPPTLEHWNDLPLSDRNVLPPLGGKAGYLQQGRVSTPAEQSEKPAYPQLSSPGEQSGKASYSLQGRVSPPCEQSGMASYPQQRRVSSPGEQSGMASYLQQGRVSSPGKQSAIASYFLQGRVSPPGEQSGMASYLQQGRVSSPGEQSGKASGKPWLSNPGEKITVPPVLQQTSQLTSQQVSNMSIRIKPRAHSHHKTFDNINRKSSLSKSSTAWEVLGSLETEMKSTDMSPYRRKTRSAMFHDQNLLEPSLDDRKSAELERRFSWVDAKSGWRRDRHSSGRRERQLSGRERQMSWRTRMSSMSSARSSSLSRVTTASGNRSPASRSSRSTLSDASEISVPTASTRQRHRKSSFSQGAGNRWDGIFPDQARPGIISGSTSRNRTDSGSLSQMPGKKSSESMDSSALVALKVGFEKLRAKSAKLLGRQISRDSSVENGGETQSTHRSARTSDSQGSGPPAQVPPVGSDMICIDMIPDQEVSEHREPGASKTEADAEKEEAAPTNNPLLSRISFALCKSVSRISQSSTPRFSNSSKQEQTVQDFEIEIKQLMNIRHPNIVTLLGVYQDMELGYCMLMEFMEYGSLYDVLHENVVPLDEATSLKLLLQIADGIQHMHEAKPPIVHGDIKSANILLSHNMVAKVADLGMSIKATVRGGHGSPFWIAPECIPMDTHSPVMRKSEFSLQSDIYAFGVTMWEVFTRKNPYENLVEAGIVPKQIMKWIFESKLRPEITYQVPQDISDLIQQCWHHDSAMRPTIRQVKQRLEELHKDACTQAKYNKRPTSTRDRGKLDLLHQMLPKTVADSLSKGQKVKPESYDPVTIFFSDIVGYTDLSTQLEPSKVMCMLDRLYTKFDILCKEARLFKVETIGDAYMCVGGIPKPQADHTVRVAAFALGAVKSANETYINEDEPSLGCINVRIGFHSGPVVASVVGELNPRYCLFGDTVNTASRMESNSEANQINMSPQAHKALLSQLPAVRVQCRGLIPIKGKGDLECFFLEVSNENVELVRNAIRNPERSFLSYFSRGSHHIDSEGSKGRFSLEGLM